MEDIKNQMRMVNARKVAKRSGQQALAGAKESGLYNLDSRVLISSLSFYLTVEGKVEPVELTVKNKSPLPPNEVGLPYPRSHASQCSLIACTVTFCTAV